MCGGDAMSVGVRGNELAANKEQLSERVYYIGANILNLFARYISGLYEWSYEKAAKVHRHTDNVS